MIHQSNVIHLHPGTVHIGIVVMYVVSIRVYNPQPARPDHQDPKRSESDGAPRAASVNGRVPYDVW